MKCSKAHKLLSPYVDGELEAGGRGELESHIKTCGECARRLGELLEMRNLFAGTEELRAPYGFTTRVMAHIKASHAREKRPGLSLLVKLAEVAIALAIVSVGIISGSFLINAPSQGKAGGIVSSFSLDVFESAPPDSVGGAYLAMVEAGDEK